MGDAGVDTINDGATTSLKEELMSQMHTVRPAQTYYLRSPTPTLLEENFRLSVLDIVMPPNYNIYALVFEREDEDDKTILETFKRGIEATLKQCRHLCGTIGKNHHGDFSIFKRPDSAVKLEVQWLDDPRDNYPSYQDLEGAGFTCAKLGDPSILGIQDIPKVCPPEKKPDVVAFKLNFIPGGFVFTIHIHHFAMDMGGTVSMVRQIAQNCSSLRNGLGTPSPAWDDVWIDRSRFIAPLVTSEDQVETPRKPERHPDWLPCSWLLFHLPPAKAAELKILASGSDEEWISTYDAMAALLWRVIARNRAKIYTPDLSSVAIFGHPMDMRSRCNPPLPLAYQGNVLAAGLSIHQPRPLTLLEVITDASLAQIASFIRNITRSVTQNTLDETMARVARFRDKCDLDMPLDSLPPMSFTTTDWRHAKLWNNDFGVGRPAAFRNLSTEVVENMIVMYPPHRGNRHVNAEQGIEVLLPFESHALDMLLSDPDMAKYFEYRGVEAAG